ncbi:MAG: hypothetical protein QG630_283 [Patescibacteria group bacterium]|nr:hypothetical protein [Patescibacteria group bacterium]
MRVRIADWVNPRAVYEKNGRLFLQVSAGHIDCSICRSRIEFVSCTLHRKGINNDVIVNDSRTVVDIGLPMPKNGQAVDAYLQEALGVRVEMA